MTTIEAIRNRTILNKSGCWVWRGALNADGYGQIWHKGKTQLVHRVMYTLAIGPIPDGLTIDHVKERGCTSRACCNLGHLEPVTRKINILRGDTFQARHAAQTHCLNGHEFSPENTYIEASGSRRCRECKRALNRAYKARQRALKT